MKAKLLLIIVLVISVLSGCVSQTEQTCADITRELESFESFTVRMDERNFCVVEEEGFAFEAVIVCIHSWNPWKDVRLTMRSVEDTTDLLELMTQALASEGMECHTGTAWLTRVNG